MPAASFLAADAGHPCSALAESYLQLALAGRRREASAMVLDAVERGTTIRDIYLHVFQPVQREVGRLWQLGRISVAQEHICTAITQLVMSQLYPRLFSGEPGDRVLVATCLGGELHEIGVRMVVDLLELDGWDTYYLGADTPAAAVIEQVVAVRADLLAVSVTIGANVDGATALVRALRADQRCAATKVLVGGAPFNAAPELVARVGADAMAVDAAVAVETAAQLVPRR